jgi:type I restriction enzyme S subunit
VSRGAFTREGYKKTELGWIPEDWEVKRLGELCEVYSGGTPSTAISEYYGGEILWINSGDLNKTKIFSVEGRITELGLRNSSAKIIQPETLLIALYGATAGVVAISKIEAAINQAVLAIIPRRDFVYFLLHQLIYLQEFIKRTYKQGGQANLSGELVKSCPLALPPLPEQKKIAEILSTWDEAIEKLNSYIEAKKKLKKALMQKLLTGKQRFKEFIVREGYKKTELGWIPEDWEVKRFDEVFSFLKVEPLSREALTDKDNDLGIYNIHYGDLHATYKSELLDFDKEERVPRVKDSVTLSHNVSFLEDGDLVIADVSEDYQGIGTCIELKNLREKKVLGGLHTFSVRDYSKKTAEGFRVYLLKSFQVLTALKRIATGVSVYGISKTNLSKIKLPLPPLPEQKKIAEILSKADEEIDLLNQELEKLKIQKKGLMQKLLTGAWRVKL